LHDSDLLLKDAYTHILASIGMGEQSYYSTAELRSMERGVYIKPVDFSSPDLKAVTLLQPFLYNKALP
jgi:hypothetical protein